MKARNVVAAFLLAFGSAGACTNDFDQFDLTGSGAGATGGAGGGKGGSAGSSVGGVGGGLGGSNLGGTSGRGGGTSGRGGAGGAAGSASGRGGTSGEAGATGEAGTTMVLECAEDEKECDGACVKEDDPSTSCADPDACTPCSLDHAEATCSDGACAVARCDPGFADCNTNDADGCETDIATEAETCGSCTNDCTGQNLGVCVDGLCGCGSDGQCGNGSGVACANDLCSCDDIACRPGERCRQSGPDRLCSCNDGAGCGPEEACCQTPSGCVNIQTSPTSCGSCGRACTQGFACAAGQCQCDSDEDCGADPMEATGASGGGGEGGAPASGPRCVSGLCACDTVTCGEGERCVAPGSCG